MRISARQLNGFSLPELMIIVVMIGILAGVAGPTLINVIRLQRLRTAAVNLGYQLTAARVAAQRSNSPCELEQSGSLLQAVSGSCGPQPPPPLDLSRDAQGEAVILSGSETTFRFAPGGLVAGTTGEQIVDLSIARFTPRVCLRIQRPSGLVSIGVANDGNTRNCVYND
jgi:type II secretory pathway pseudopilin PulG